jgi:hypothetical protein
MRPIAARTNDERPKLSAHDKTLLINLNPVRLWDFRRGLWDDGFVDEPIRLPSKRVSPKTNLLNAWERTVPMTAG